MRPSTATSEAASLPSEVRAIPLSPPASRRPTPSTTPGSTTSPIRFRLGRWRFGSQSLNFLCASSQIGIGGAEIGRVGLCIVVAVCQRWSNCEPACNTAEKRFLVTFLLMILPPHSRNHCLSFFPKGAENLDPHKNLKKIFTLVFFQKLGSKKGILH